MQLVLDISDLHFRYTKPAHTCFQSLNLQIKQGERFGLFGPNGAGKTTLMHLMTGLLTYPEGSIKIEGLELKLHAKELKQRMGLVPQDFAFYQELSPQENFNYFGALYGLSRKEIQDRSAELLDVLNLADVKNKAVAHFSGGMKRRVNLGIGILHRPRLLFLDEPTVGVDVQTRQEIMSYLKDLNKTGTTLIYTSHQLAEAQELCDHIALLNEGTIVADDSPENLFTKYKETQLENLFLQLTAKNH